MRFLFTNGQGTKHDLLDFAQQIERRAAFVQFVIILVIALVALALFVPMG